MRYSKEQIDQHFQQLPEEVQDALLSTETSAAIQEIGNNYNLHIDVIGALNQEIVYVLVGLEKMADFAANVRRFVEMPTEHVDKVVRDVNDRVFKPVREAMKNQPDLTEEGEGNEVSNSAAGPTAPVGGDREGRANVEPAPTKGADTTPEHHVPTQKRSSFANKLKERTAMRAQEQTAGKQSGEQAAGDGQQSKYRTADPYREPIGEEDLNKPTE